MQVQRLGVDPTNAEFVDGYLRAGGRSMPPVQLAADGELVTEDATEYADLDRKYYQSIFGEHFVEVGVDVDTGEFRIRARWRCLCTITGSW